MEILMMYVPFGTLNDAENAVQKLLDEKLIACANIIHSDSLYFWNQSLTKENEWIAVMKSDVDLTIILQDQIKLLHPYQTPAIINWKVQCNQEYYDWVKSQVINTNK
jgi:periplasmic divalent cation tolerance protein